MHLHYRLDKVNNRALPCIHIKKYSQLYKKKIKLQFNITTRLANTKCEFNTCF